MELVKEFLSDFGISLVMAVLTAVAGFLGTQVKRTIQKYADDSTKKNVVKTCVRAVEQLYKDLHGEEKFAKAVENTVELLNEKGLAVSQEELTMLIEAAVSELNCKLGGLYDD